MTKLRSWRALTALAATLIVVSGAFGVIRYGAICSLDVAVLSVIDPVVGPLVGTFGALRIPITVTCPLGYLERSLAAGMLLPQWPLYAALVLASVVLVGRVFCAWICPVVLVRATPGRQAGPDPVPSAEAGGSRWADYSPYAFLAGVLLASYLFRFPVFCLVCPIGLFFGWVYAAMRLFTPTSWSLELVVFPAMLAIELLLLRKHWCRSICPLGGLLSLVGGLNRFLIPAVRKDRCLTSKGIDCRVCERACGEGIELVTPSKRLLPNSCTKCLECYEKCPVKAIEIAAVK